MPGSVLRVGLRETYSAPWATLGSCLFSVSPMLIFVPSGFRRGSGGACKIRHVPRVQTGLAVVARSCRPIFVCSWVSCGSTFGTTADSRLTEAVTKSCQTSARVILVSVRQANVTQVAAARQILFVRVWLRESHNCDECFRDSFVHFSGHTQFQTTGALLKKSYILDAGKLFANSIVET